MNNILYLATDDSGLVKIGYTETSSQNRIKQFANYYPKKFKEVTSFTVKEVNAESVEKFIHEVLNAQFLNLKLMYDKFNFVEYQSYVKNSPNGYTEIFLSNPSIINNLFTFFHTLRFIELKDIDIQKIHNIKSFNENELKKYYPQINSFIEEEGKKEGLASPTIITKRINIFKNNFDKWFNEISKNFNSIDLIIENNHFFFLSNKKKIRLENFLFGSINDESCLYIKNNLKCDYDIDYVINTFFNSLNSLQEQNTNLSPQRSSFQYKNKKFLEIQHHKKLELKRSTSEKSKFKDFSSFLKKEEVKDIISNSINQFKNYLETNKEIIKSDLFLESPYFNNFLNHFHNNKLESFFNIECKFLNENDYINWVNIKPKKAEYKDENLVCYPFVDYVIKNLEKMFNNNFTEQEKNNQSQYFKEKDDFVFTCLSAIINPERLKRNFNYKYFDNSKLYHKVLKCTDYYLTNSDISDHATINTLLKNNFLLFNNQNLFLREKAFILTSLFSFSKSQSFKDEEYINSYYNKLSSVEVIWNNLAINFLDKIKNQKQSNHWKDPIKIVDEYFVDFEEHISIYRKSHKLYHKNDVIQDFLEIEIEGQSIESHLLSINANNYVNNKIKNSLINWESFSNKKQFQLSRTILNYSDNKVHFSNKNILKAFSIFLYQSSNSDLKHEIKSYEMQTVIAGLKKLKEKNILLFEVKQFEKPIFNLLTQFENKMSLDKNYIELKSKIIEPSQNKKRTLN